MADQAAFEAIQREWREEGLPRINAGLTDWTDNRIAHRLAAADERDWPPADVILKEVAAQSGVSIVQLRGQGRSADLSHVRHMAMYLMHELRGLSAEQAGRLLNRDRSTASAAIQSMRRKIKRDPAGTALYDRTLRALRERME